MLNLRLIYVERRSNEFRADLLAEAVDLAWGFSQIGGPRLKREENDLITIGSAHSFYLQAFVDRAPSRRHRTICLYRSAPGNR